MKINSLAAAAPVETPQERTQSSVPSAAPRSESAFTPGPARSWNRFQGLTEDGVFPPGGGIGPTPRRPSAKPPVTLPEPSTGSQHAPYEWPTYQNSNGYTLVTHPMPLFDGSSDLGREVFQGWQNMGDCYLAATVSELAERRPDLIKSMIKDNGDGTVSVRLYARNAHGTLEPKWIRVDEKLPMWPGSSSDLYYGTTNTSPSLTSLWWPLIEKAYAQTVGGYDKLAVPPNDSAGAAWEALTGQPDTHLSFSPSSDPVQTAKELQSMLASGKLVVVGTPQGSGMEQHGITPFHVYSVYGAGVDSHGNGYVDLRNPWGFFEPGDSIGRYGYVIKPKDGTDDGYFRMPMTQFLQFFNGGDVVTPPPAAKAKTTPSVPTGVGNFHEEAE